MSRLHLALATIVAFAAVALLAFADEGGDGAAELQRVEPFTGVHFGLPGTLTLVQTDEPLVTIDATPEQLERIVVEVEGDTLALRKRKRTRDGLLDGVRVQVGYQSLEALALAGSGNAYADSISAESFALSISGSGSAELQALTSDALRIAIAGSGDVRVQALDAQGVRTKIAGSGDVELTGSAVKQELSIAGSGSYAADAVDGASADISIAGSGSVRLNVRERITGTLAGSGDLLYRGEPEVDVRIAGSGKVDQVAQAF